MDRSKITPAVIKQIKRDARKASKENADTPYQTLLEQKAREYGFQSFHDLNKHVDLVIKAPRQMPALEEAKEPVVPSDQQIMEMLQHAVDHVHANEPEVAVGILDELIERSPDFHPAYWLRGMCFAIDADLPADDALIGGFKVEEKRIRALSDLYEAARLLDEMPESVYDYGNMFLFYSAYAEFLRLEGSPGEALQHCDTIVDKYNRDIRAGADLPEFINDVLAYIYRTRYFVSAISDSERGPGEITPVELENLGQGILNASKADDQMIMGALYRILDGRKAEVRAHAETGSR